MYHLFLYSMVGASAALVDFALFFFSLRYIHSHYIIASMISFSCAVTTNFFLCNQFVFKRENISLFDAYIRHISTNICSFLLGLFILSALLETKIFLSPFFPKVFTSAFLMIFNYSCARWFSFNNTWHAKDISWKKKLPLLLVLVQQALPPLMNF